MKTKLNIGDQIPAFSLKDQSGNLVDITSFFGKKKLVIYFYPKNDTPGCTREACSFRDQFEDFVDPVLRLLELVLIALNRIRNLLNNTNCLFGF